jgi:hypothetical protein
LFTPRRPATSPAKIKNENQSQRKSLRRRARADGVGARAGRSGGWEVGVGPSIVVLDSGTATTLTITTLLSDVYAFVFNQTGLMAGVGLQGSKITEIQQ